MVKLYEISLLITDEQMENLESAVRKDDHPGSFSGGGYTTDVRETLRAKVGAAIATAREAQ